jgi:hypothetical protein
MPRQKVLAPDRSHHLEVRVKRSPKFFDVTRVTQFINRTAVLPLCDGWQARVGTHFSSDLTSGELRYLEYVLCDYVIKRTGPVPWEELLRRLDGVLTAASAFRDALTELDLSDFVWKRIRRELPAGRRDNLLPGNVLREVSTFSNAVNAALARAKEEKAKGNNRNHGGPFEDLVNALADLFERKGERPTAAKSSSAGNPKLSPFVALVVTVMLYAVPSKLREHLGSGGTGGAAGSESAMTAAIAKVLARRRADRKRSAGPFHEILDEISPSDESREIRDMHHHRPR